MKLNFKYKTLLRFFSVSYFTLLLYLVFLVGRRHGLIDFRSRISLIPFQQKIDFLRYNGNNDIQSQFDFYSDIIGNVVMFIPFPFAFLWLGSRRYSNRIFFVLLIIFTFSIEIIQYVFNIGVCDIDDIILNITGGFLGLLLFNFKPFNF